MEPGTKVYKPRGWNGYELCHPVNQEDFERINLIVNGSLQPSTWADIEMQLIRVDEGTSLVASDAPWLGSQALVLRPRGVDAMGPVLRANGTLHPLSCSEANLLVYCPNCIDALDEAASTVERFDDGSIMMIERHIFRADAVADVGAFRIPNLRVSPTYVSHQFVERWREAGLEGLKFKEVWSA
jgi:hypothetical protein